MSQHTLTEPVPTTGFRRPIAPSEWFFLGHPAELAATLQIVVEGTGTLDAEELRDAVAVASAACPGSRLVPDGRSWADSGVTPRVHVVDGRGLGAAGVLALPELQAPLTGEPRCEVVLVQGDPISVAFRADHAVMDAKGALTWALDVFRALRGEVPLGAPDPVSDRDVFADLPGAEELVTPGYTQPPVLPGCEPTDHTRFVAGRRSIQGSHPALVAKLATLLTREDAPSIFYIPVDLRHHRPGVRSTANFSSGFYLRVEPGEDAGSVHERLLRELADGAAVRKAPPTGLLDMPLSQVAEAMTTIDRRSRERDAYPSDAVLAHVGRVDPALLHTPGFTAHSVYPLARPCPGGAPELNIAEVGGRTEITLTWWEGAETAGRIEALLDRIAEALSPAADRYWAANDTAVEPSTSDDIVRRFLRQAAETPDALALDAPDEQLTYAELAHRSGVVAAALRELGAGPETLVGLLSDRSVAAVVAIWGVLRAGAAYLPLDPVNPDARIAGLLADSGAPICLVERPCRTRDCLPPDCVKLVIEDLDFAGEPAVPDLVIPDDRLAYVIYTSGSTGKPKGVEISHGCLRHYVAWAVREFELDHRTRLPLLASIAFDVSVNTLLPPLMAGGAIVVRPGEITPALLHELLTTSGATMLSLTPSHLALINHLGLRPTGFRKVVTMGELLTTSVAREAQEVFGPDCAIVNSYGPTETTIVMTLHPFDAATDTRGSVPIGVPTDNSTVFLLDAHGRFAPAGTTGEVCIGGAQLARGYLGRPDITRQKFVRLADGTRVYRSGDLARLLPTGELEFLARTDDQVKVLGHRVEPAEIVRTLESHPAVARAVVVPRGTGEQKALCAYVVARHEVTADELHRHLAGLLPKYLIPAATVFVTDIPQTVNGKVDVRALPEPFPAGAGPVAREHRDEVTEQVAAIWAELLDVSPDHIAADADFHELGGNSLLFLAMVAAVTRTVVGESGSAAFNACLGRLVHEPTLKSVAETAREAALTTA
ncbi:amino acid adenylation domain-containing protein [Amycolatopsis sp.]|uniref:amino acid adenylation domain-containing protein n=1 Tax=Amycolatopsis sp. TaxID=37632 RepID=UPI002D8007A1|nr:amino acid adenylation domain-containing protein [Amycolatopsis sp.]HET6707371.1 amino acid adenylation domain-containing protein [Amycolatopsis sp.]